MNRNKITSLPERKRAEKCRYFASLHCKKYRGCLDEVTKNGKPMRCHKCTEWVIEKNYYRRAMGVPSPDHTSFPLRLPVISHKS